MPDNKEALQNLNITIKNICYLHLKLHSDSGCRSLGFSGPQTILLYIDILILIITRTVIKTARK